jgi:plastocyanin
VIIEMRRSFVIAGVATMTLVVILVLSVGYFAPGTGQTSASSTTNTESSQSSSKSSVSTSSGTTQTSTSTTRRTTTSTQQVSIATVNVTIIRGAASNKSAAGYSPDNFTLIIGVNNTVTWTNRDASPHTASSMSGAFNSGNLNPGQSYTFTFTAPGTYVYYCAYHGYMHGTVIVKSDYMGYAPP